MDLRESLEKLELKIIDLVMQPYFKYYLKTLPNSLDLQENITLVLDEIRSVLRENDLYIYNHYEILVENYYSLLNFYEEQVELSAFFASQEVLRMMGLNPDLEMGYDIFFKVDFSKNDIPIDINLDNNIENNFIGFILNNDEEDYLLFLVKMVNFLKKIKEKNQSKELNMEVENLYFLMSYQLQNIRNNKLSLNSDNYNQLFNTINQIQSLLINIGWLTSQELLKENEIPSKKVDKNGIIEIKDSKDKK